MFDSVHGVATIVASNTVNRPYRNGGAVMAFMTPTRIYFCKHHLRSGAKVEKYGYIRGHLHSWAD